MGTKRIQVIERVGHISFGDYEYLSFDEMIEALTNEKIFYEQKYQAAIRFYLENEYFGHDGAYQTNIMMVRHENDKEYEKRIEKLEKQKQEKKKNDQKQKDHELELLNKLAKKFGKELTDVRNKG
jgi:ABC-type lipoprotein release transport system permease subunit